MSTPTPTQSLAGGAGLALATHGLLVLNGSIMGISGFIHRAIRGNFEALSSVAGLVLGGACVGFITAGPPPPLPATLPHIFLAGLLVGVGTKLSNGCTSGHMIAGLSRFSQRSIAATATFCTWGAITAQILHRNSMPATSAATWTLGDVGKSLLLAQTIPLAATVVLHLSALRSRGTGGDDKHTDRPHSSLRLLACLSTTFDFALALRLSNLTDPDKVISFLLLPFHPAFDPSLAYLAAGALPLAMILYHYYRGSERPLLGGTWAVPKGGTIDAKLLIGSTLFGIGWGTLGICPGPALVNFGWALATRSNTRLPLTTWLSAFSLGGLLV